MYAAVAVAIGMSVMVYRRATAGVSGPSIRQPKIEAIATLRDLLCGL